MKKLLAEMLFDTRGYTIEAIAFGIAAMIAAAVLILLYVRAGDEAGQSIDTAGAKTREIVNNISV